MAAAEVKHTYEDYQKTIIYKPSEEIIETARANYQASLPKAKVVVAHKTIYRKNGYWERQCVAYAKTLTGVYGTWGNGGRYLSNNTNPVVGAVIIFDYTHVGVITARGEGGSYYTDRNYDLRGGIRYNVWIADNNPTIWKYHTF